MIRRFIAYYKPYIGLFVLDMACAFLIAGIDLVYPLISKYALNTLIPQNQFRAFYVWMLIMLGCYVLKGFFQYIVTHWGHWLGVQMEVAMRRDLFTHMQHLSYRFYDENRTGSLMSRLTNDLFEVVELAHHGPEDLFISLITLIGAVAVMFSLQWQLATVITLLVPLLVAFTIYRRRSMSKSSKRVKEKIARINTDIESAISGVRTAKAFTNEPYERQRFEEGSAEYKAARKVFYREMAIFSGGSEIISNLMQVAVIAAGGFLISKQRLDLVDLLVFTMYISTFLAPVRKLANFVEQYTTGMAGFSRFSELMDTPADIVDAPDAKPLVCTEGHVELKDVTFAYKQRDVLSHVSLDIPSGKTVALVGPSGGGKTTLCHLIPRFYEKNRGEILIDGQEIASVTVQSLRQQVGIVQQDAFIFAGTMMDNIRYGRLDATDEEVMEAARRAEIHDFIMELPDGYQTPVGERGVTLSGGQKQRVSIARIFLKNPKILLLDEATSALDTVTEAHIQHAFEELSKGRTTLVVAHRLSTIRNADCIIYMDREGIRETGTHEELMAKNGFYAELQRATLAVQ